ncbi:hypothetical protein Q1695_014641 [Nippostrongylus brasiliensis]|nr:hypothetical protein Q1695_014641 [Nippostrongylus brasiliensis]
MAVRVERCPYSLPTAPPNSSTFRIISMDERMLAFRVRCPNYRISPSRYGFIEGGAVQMVTVAPFDDIQPDDDIRIDWIEVDPQERDPARAFRLFRSHTRACGTVSQPIQSRDSLREDKCPSALLRAHSDPWADVRRPWMVIKFGNTTVAIRDSDAIWAAVQQIHDALSVHHVMLEEAPLFYSLQSLNAKEVTIEAQTRIRAAKKRLFPVLLLTDDDKEPGVFSAYVRERLSRDVYVFEVSGQELADIASSSSERPYKHLDDWCREFSSIVEQTEKTQKQSLRKGDSDVDLPERASNFADGGRMHDEYAEGHRGISNANERELSADDEDASSSFDCRSELVYSPCGSSKEKGVIVTADDVNEALRYAKNNPSDSSLVLDIAHPHIFNRLAAPFRGPIPNIRLMQLLYISCSRKSHLKEVNDCACRLIGIVISTRFIPTLCVRFGVPAVNNPHAWDDDFTDFLVVIMQLFSIIDGFNYHGEDVFHAWTTYYDLLVELPDEFWRDEVSKDWLEDMAVELKHLGHYRPLRTSPEVVPIRERTNFQPEDEKSDRIGSKSTQRGLRHVLRDEIEPPLWQECERNPPPCDFRTMSILPKRCDIDNAEKSYLRRAIIDGSYTNSEHYLDVQFRLFRNLNNIRAFEDHEASTSNVMLHEINNISGLQVSRTDGVPLRSAKLTTPLSEDMQRTCLIFGQIVCLSSDGFREELHLARIVTNEMVNETICFSPFTEDEVFAKSGKYLLAEPNAFLEFYEHVLAILQTFDKDQPLPFERYIVYGKTDVRKPKYMRFGEVAQEDGEAQGKGGDKTAGLDTGTSKKTKRSDEDDSSDSDEPDILIMKPGGRVVTVDGQTNILINGTTYEVDKLSEQFKPSNLDGSQQRAIVRALTEELAIIQGPPGTGKTFIGVEAASILLQNRQRWGIIEPILVVAHSNNAVDQFSERLIEKINADIEKGFLRHDGPLAVRLGGQSGSEFLKRWRFTKLDVVKQFRFLCSEETNEKLQSQQRKKMSALERLQEASFVLHCFKRHLISLNCLKKNNVIPGSLLAEMRTWKGCHCDSQGNPLDDEEVLACWLLGRAYNQKNCREMPLEEEEDSREKNAEREQLFSADDADGLETLDDLLENANKYADDDEELNDELYLTEKVWDIVDTGYVAKEVILLEGRVKGYFEKSFGQGKPPLDRTFKQECSEALHAIFRAVPMSSEEAADVKSMFSLPKGRRWELYMFWMKQLRDRIRKSLPSSMESYRLACKRTRDASCKVNAEVLRRCLFVSATTTGAAKERELLRRLRCPIVFVEEAALVLEAHTLSTLLPSVEHVVLIGDHQQLKPSAEVYELAREYHLDVSMFERLVRNGHPYSTLQVQHRMNTDITENIIRPFFYPSVADSESVRNYPEVPGMHKKCFFWMHEEPETTPFNETSRSCSYEVTMVVALVSYLKKQGIALNEITVLATYWAQATDIQKAMAANFGLLPDGGAAIDENRIVIVSLVRSFMDGIGFLGVQNRVTVALTRARHGMYVVGNLVYLARCSSFWRDIAHHIYNKGFAGDRLPIRCQRHGNVQTIEHPSDFAEKSPDGGCMEICNGELPCGHTCPRRCHPIDDHDSYKCLKQCRRRCKNEQYRHSCQRPCCEECGDCYQVVTVSLNCGHSTNATCSAVASARCDQRCEKLLQCGHRCPARCGQPCDAPCLEPVTVTNDVCNHSWTVACSEVSSAGECPMNCPEILPCGHQCAELCGKPCTFSCMKLVKRELKCGHKVSLPCSEDETKKLCEVGVLQEIAECGHSAILPCHAGSDRRFCPKQCGKVLPCGHTCSRECGECHREGECRCQDVCDKLLRCGHKCAKRCWESCEPCMQLCLNSCKHRDCGNSGGDQPFKYGRNCSQLCVLCPQLCDNICRHRSCSNRCYEECSVGRCEQPCTKKLACGHACLGMCGEECPRLCGTCNKPAYLRLLEKHMESSHALSKLPRIIELDRCGHIFPVEFLDKHMETLEAQSEPLRCPLSTCQALIVRVQRYVKIVRKRYLDRYSKLMSQSEPTPPNAAVLLLMNCTRMKQEVEISRKNAPRQKFKYQQNSLSNDVNELLNANCEAIRLEISTKNSEFHHFWEQQTKCVILLSKLVRRYTLTMKHYKYTARNQPLFCVSPSLKAREAFNAEANKLCDWLSRYCTTRMKYAVIPRARYLSVRALFYSDLMTFEYICNAEKKNPSNSAQLQALRKSVERVEAATMDQDYMEVFGEFENLIMGIANEVTIKSKFNCQMRIDARLNLPDF